MALLIEGYDFAAFRRDVNGTEGYSSDAAAIGYVPPVCHLKLLFGLALPLDFSHDFDYFGQGNVTPEIVSNRTRDFLAINIQTLASAGMRLNEAKFGAVLRYFMVRHGWIASELENRAVYVNEYEIATNAANTEGITGLRVGEAIDLSLPSALIRFVGNYYQSIVGVVEHVFRVRGHHYKPEYESTYNRTWACTTIEVPANITMPNWEQLSRTVLHCFGIKALFDCRVEAADNDKLPRGLVIRGSAAPAGSASVRTCVAGITEMRQALWFPAFERHFGLQIQEAELHAQDLITAGINAHVNCKLYGRNRIPYITNEATIASLVPYVLAFIDCLSAGEPIKGQKTLNKRAQGGSAIRAEFLTVLVSESRNAAGYRSVEEYLSQQVPR